MIKKVFPILAICVFSSTLGMGIVTPLLPLYIRDLGASSIWLGVIVGAYFFSNSVFVPIAGRMSDRKGRKLFLTVGLFAYALISVGYIWADNVALLALVRLLHGIAGAVTIPVAMAYVGDLSPEGEEGRWTGYATAAFFSGFGFGPLLGGVLAQHLGMNAAFLTMGGLNLIAFVIAFFFLPEVTNRRMGEEFHLSFKEMSQSGLVRGLFSFRLTESLGRGGIAAFLPILAAGFGLSTSLIGVLLSANILSITLFTPIGGLIADKVNRRILTIIGLFSFSMLLAVIPLTANFFQLLVVLLLQGLSAGVSMSASMALTVEEGRRFGMGSTMSMLFLGMSIGGAVGPVISGGIAEWLNTNWVFFFGAALGIVGVVLFSWFTRDYRSHLPSRQSQEVF